MDKETVKRFITECGATVLHNDIYDGGPDGLVIGDYPTFEFGEMALEEFIVACCDWQKENSDHYEALMKIQQWANAYPLEVFPEPDFKKAAQVLKENGMTIDAISASNMRHVLSGIKDIIDSAIRNTKDTETDLEQAQRFM
jgi:hypothetical protein